MELPTDLCAVCHHYWSVHALSSCSGSHDTYEEENTQSRYYQNSQLLKDMEAAFNLRIHTSNLVLQVNGRTLKQGLTIYVVQLFCALYMHCKIIIIP